MWSLSIDPSPWRPQDRVISFKVCKDLSEFSWNGDMLKYKEWREMLRDHLIGTNQGYGRIVHEIEQ